MVFGGIISQLLSLMMGLLVPIPVDNALSLIFVALNGLLLLGATVWSFLAGNGISLFGGIG